MFLIDLQDFIRVLLLEFLVFLNQIQELMAKLYGTVQIVFSDYTPKGG
jgi:hypothetical protein